MEVLNIIALLVKLLESFKIQAINVYVWMDIMMMKSILSALVIIILYHKLQNYLKKLECGHLCLTCNQ